MSNTNGKCKACEEKTGLHNIRKINPVSTRAAIEAWKLLSLERFFHRYLKKTFKGQRNRVLRNPLKDRKKFFDKKLEDKYMRSKILPAYNQVIVNQEKKAIAMLGLGAAFHIRDKETASYMGRKAFKFADQVNSTTQKKLRRTLSEGVKLGETYKELQDRTSKVFKNTVRGAAPRSMTIARTEVHSVSGYTMDKSYKQAGVKLKRWMSFPGCRPGHCAANGQTKKIDEPFRVRNPKGIYESLRFPGDPMGSPGNICNCRCISRPLITTTQEVNPATDYKWRVDSSKKSGSETIHGRLTKWRKPTVKEVSQFTKTIEKSVPISLSKKVGIPTKPIKLGTVTEGSGAFYYPVTRELCIPKYQMINNEFCRHEYFHAVYHDNAKTRALLLEFENKMGDKGLSHFAYRMTTERPSETFSMMLESYSKNDSIWAAHLKENPLVIGKLTKKEALKRIKLFKDVFDLE